MLKEPSKTQRSFLLSVKCVQIPDAMCEMWTERNYGRLIVTANTKHLRHLLLAPYIFFASRRASERLTVHWTSNQTDGQTASVFCAIFVRCDNDLFSKKEGKRKNWIKRSVTWSLTTLSDGHTQKNNAFECQSINIKLNTAPHCVVYVAIIKSLSIATGATIQKEWKKVCAMIGWNTE